MVIAPCGFDPARGLQESATLGQLPGWDQLSAVINNRVFVADSNLFTCPSTDLVDGIELLPSLFHPGLFDLPERLIRAVSPMKSLYAV
jgi:iron complex transport system substrate-binding protein